MNCPNSTTSLIQPSFHHCEESPCKLQGKDLRVIYEARASPTGIATAFCLGLTMYKKIIILCRPNRYIVYAINYQIGILNSLSLVLS